MRLNDWNILPESSIRFICVSHTAVSKTSVKAITHWRFALETPQDVDGCIQLGGAFLCVLWLLIPVSDMCHSGRQGLYQSLMGFTAL